MQTPRKILESFISDMIMAWNEEKSLILKTRDAWTDLDRDPKYANNPALSVEWQAKKNEASCKYKAALRCYREKQAKVLESYSLVVPKDFFLSLPAECNYCGDQIVREDIVNKNKVKLFTESTANEYYNYYKNKVFVFVNKNGIWLLTNVKRIDEKTGKEEKIQWA